MTADEARDYLEAAAQTATGQQALHLLGLRAVIDHPRNGTDASSIIVAERVIDLLRRQYLDR